MNLFTKISVLVLIPIMVFAAQDPSNVPALRARLAQCDKLSDGSNMSLCVANVGANTDTELNRVYAALTAQYAELAKGETHDGSDYNTQLLSRLRIAERAWLTYRDAQCNADVGGDDHSLFCADHHSAHRCFRCSTFFWHSGESISSTKADSLGQDVEVGKELLGISATV